ncbi:hypothetical protein ACFOYY_41355, partial [Streptosporangium jomthongense]
RDYAFVTVYNGVFYGGSKQVTVGEYNSFVGPKWIDKKEISESEYNQGVSKYGVNGPYKTAAANPKVETVNPPKASFTEAEAKAYAKGEGEDKTVKLVPVEVTAAQYKAAPEGTSALKNGERCPSWCGVESDKKTAISQETYKELLAKKANGGFLGELSADKDANGNEIAWYEAHYYVKGWVKTTTAQLYWVETYRIEISKDAGRLGDNVGGQGFAWNQKTGQPVFIFGYPEGPHPDG